MKELLLYALWFASQTEYRGKDTTETTDWYTIRYNSLYGYGTNRYNSKRTFYISRKVAKHVVGTYTSIEVTIWRTPYGYVYILDKEKRPERDVTKFWLDEFNAMKKD